MTFFPRKLLLLLLLLFLLLRLLLLIIPDPRATLELVYNKSMQCLSVVHHAHGRVTAAPAAAAVGIFRF